MSKLGGQKTRGVLQQLCAHESRNITFVDPDGSWPIVWERARGVQVWDIEGRKYLDFTAAFGVAASGHANPRVVRAGQRQMGKLLHAMGDVHPHALKAELAKQLSDLTFGRWTKGTVAGKVVFCSSGFEAVEVALKTALLATNKSRVIAFEGAYHGTGYGTLSATHRDHFKNPFRRQLSEFADFIKFPANENESKTSLTQIKSFLNQGKIGAVLLEPMQARGGINIPPPDFLPTLRKLCTASGVLLVLDEIYTGFGRTGEWFACDASGTVPDLICLGKALTGGFPLSACVGRGDMMDRAWPVSQGEAIHTSTFLGHPVGCAMALAQIKELRAKQLISRSRSEGNYLLKKLRQLKVRPGIELSARGVGLMAGIELNLPDGKPATAFSLCVIKALLQRGFILLPEGAEANVVSFTPPLTISRSQIDRLLTTLQAVLLLPEKTS